MKFRKRKSREQPGRIVRRMPQANPYASYHERQSARPATPSVGRQVQRMGDDRSPKRGVTQDTRDKLLKNLLRRRKLALGLIVAVVLFAIYSLTYVSSMPEIKVVTDGAKKFPGLHTSKDYELAASKLLGGSLVNHNKITIDTVTIEQDLKKEFPELRAVSVSLPLIGWNSVITVTPSLPVAILQSPRSSFVIDSSGFAIGDATKAVGRDLPIIVDQSGLVITRGQRALPSSSVSLVVDLLAQLKAKQVTVESFILPKGDAQELDLRVSGASYYTKFSTVQASTYQQQIGDYFALRDYLAAHRITPKEYVDVRVSSRAYYK